jgi:uncharacterized protein YajQ (UPF0234 family)
MPSFDVVSEVDMQEVRNAVDQANRELTNRFDFKNTGAKFALTDKQITLTAPNEFQVKQMYDILTGRFTARKVDSRCLSPATPQVNVNETRQVVTVQMGIETDLAKKLVKLIKEQKLKVQPSIQGDKVRVTGKKKDDLQEIIGFLKDTNIGRPLQFENYRD